MFWHRRKPSDFADEIEAHIRMEADRLHRDGMSESEAQAMAKRTFGNPTRAGEDFYNRTRIVWWDHLWRDLAYGFRSLKRSPAFTATAIVTLALGIGANTALFSVIDTVLIRPLPYPDPDRLVMLYSRFADTEMNGPSPADFLVYKNQSHSFEHLAAFRDLSMNINGHDRAQRILGVVVTPGFFEVMKVPAQIGRTFTPADKPGTPIVVLSHSLWQEDYAADPNIVGKSIEIDGTPRTITGVMPAQFRLPLEAQLWTLSRFAVIAHPLSPFSDPSNRRGSHYFDTVGRLKPGVTLAQAQAETNVIARRLKRQFGSDEDAIGSAVVNLHEDLVGNTRSTLLLLLGGVGLLLLIACANVANILLARGSSRQREIAVRAALGASRFRIVRQLLTESLLLSIAGGCAAVLTAYFALFPLRASIPPEMLLGIEPALDPRVLAFTFAVSLVSGIVFGVFPALHYSKADLNEALKGASRSATAGTRAQRTQTALVISEIAFATVLLISAGLLIRSFRQLLTAPEGFNPRNVLSMDLSFSPSRYPTPASRVTFVNRALDGIKELPGITSAAVTSKLPLGHGDHTRDIHIKGRTTRPSEDMNVDYTAVSPDYFQTLNIPVVRGRTFTQRDTSNSAPVVIVNEAAARRFWPKQDPLL
ncbi:MAG: ADOP family duplicated permease, partial [Bryobacteraceae bacterium]